jgi:hypothetical protein
MRRVAALAAAAGILLLASALAGEEKPGLESRVAKGTFTVEITPHREPSTDDGLTFGRMALAKVFAGDLVGTGEGEMLTAVTPVPGSAGYVAIERVEGVLHGRSGGFFLQHSGTMDRGAQRLAITIVPDSGTGELAGIAGELRLEIRDGRHFYEIEYTLPE